MTYKYLPGMLTRRERELMQLFGPRNRCIAKTRSTLSLMAEIIHPSGKRGRIINVRTDTLDRLVNYGKLTRTLLRTPKHSIPFWQYDAAY